MDIMLVNLAGALLIAWIVWYFFLSRRPAEGRASESSARQEIQVTVKGGYSPERIVARPGVPLRIHFRREETSPCSEEVVFPHFGIRRSLGAFETTVVDLPAAAEGTYGFACGMDMMHGSLVVGDAVDAAPSPAPPAPLSAPLPAPAMAVDPICGMSVDPAHAAGSSQRDGTTFYFCGLGCKARFDAGGAPGPMEQRITLGRAPKR